MAPKLHTTAVFQRSTQCHPPPAAEGFRSLSARENLPGADKGHLGRRRASQARWQISARPQRNRFWAVGADAAPTATRMGHHVDTTDTGGYRWLVVGTIPTRWAMRCRVLLRPQGSLRAAPRREDRLAISRSGVPSPRPRRIACPSQTPAWPPAPLPEGPAFPPRPRRPGAIWGATQKGRSLPIRDHALPRP